MKIIIRINMTKKNNIDSNKEKNKTLWKKRLLLFKKKFYSLKFNNK